MFKGIRDACSAGPKPIQIEVFSGPEAAREMLAHLMKGAQKLNLSEDSLGTVELVVAEAINNIVEHAYPPTGREGPIRLAAQLYESNFHVVLIDEGRGMPDGTLPDGSPTNVDVDRMHLPEGGFGWFLIRTQSKDLSYERAGWENRLSFHIPITFQ